MTDQRKEKLKGEKALAIAKAIPRKTVFVPRGISGEVFYQGVDMAKGLNSGRKLNHSKVMEMLNEGVKKSEVATKFKVTNQAIDYIWKKYKAA